jgi:hypothetical protein
MNAQVRYILTMMADGRMAVAEARKRLRGLTVPDGPARLIKEGRWASGGSYASGDIGARHAARDALRADSSSGATT